MYCVLFLIMLVAIKFKDNMCFNRHKVRTIMTKWNLPHKHWLDRNFDQSFRSTSVIVFRNILAVWILRCGYFKIYLPINDLTPTLSWRRGSFFPILYCFLRFYCEFIKAHDCCLFLISINISSYSELQFLPLTWKGLDGVIYFY